MFYRLFGVAKTIATWYPHMSTKPKYNFPYGRRKKRSNTFRKRTVQQLSWTKLYQELCMTMSLCKRPPTPPNQCWVACSACDLAGDMVKFVFLVGNVAATIYVGTTLNQGGWGGLAASCAYYESLNAWLVGNGSLWMNTCLPV